MSENRIPTLADFANAEHCVLEDVTVQQPALNAVELTRDSEARHVCDEIEVKDKLRGRRTLVRIFDEGWLDLEVERRGRATTHHRIDLRYLDPVPSMTRHHPLRLLKAAGIAAGVTAVCAIPAWLGWLQNWFIPAAIAAAVATGGLLFVAFYLSHEKIHFRTLHGRADVVRFGAGLGTIRRFRKLVPAIVDAIADAAESVDDETAVYLRSEMREHYRLRGAGVLSEEQCAESTGRILGQFDGPL
jgi:hypothetical protein